MFDLQEVITNEHVVAMMKAAINDTEAVPPFVSVDPASSQHVWWINNDYF